MDWAVTFAAGMCARMECQLDVHEILKKKQTAMPWSSQGITRDACERSGNEHAAIAMARDACNPLE
jgi:hypothetical protein